MANATPTPTPTPQIDPQLEEFRQLQEFRRLKGSSENYVPQVIQEMHPNISMKERLVAKNLATNPEAQVKYLKKQHPDMDIRLEGGQILAKTKEDKDYKVLDPDTGFFSKDFLYDLGDLGYDIPAGMLTGAATTAGAAAGGLGAGLPTAGAGAIPGALAGGAAAGAATSGGLETLRQGLGKAAGIEQDFDPLQIGIATATGGLAPFVPPAIKAGAIKAAPKIVQGLTNIPAIATEELIQNWDKLKALGQTGATTLSEDAYKLLAQYLEQQKSAAGKAIGETLKSTGQKIGLDRVKGVIDDMLARLNELGGEHPTEAIYGKMGALKNLYDKIFKIKTPSAAQQFDDFITQQEKNLAEGQKIPIGPIKEKYMSMINELKKLQAEAPTPAINQKIKALEDSYNRLFTYKGKEKVLEEGFQEVSDPLMYGQMKKVPIQKEVEKEVVKEVSEASPEMLYQLKNDLQGFGGKINPYVPYSKRYLNEANAPQLFDIQKTLDNMVSYGGEGLTTEAKDLLEQAAIGGRKIINEELDRVTNGMSQQAKDKFKAIVKRIETLNRGFSSPQKTLMSLSSPNAQSRKFVMKEVGDIAKEGGPDITPQARMILADKYYGNPASDALSIGGTTATATSNKAASLGATLGGLLGYKIGGPVGGGFGAGAGGFAGRYLSAPSAVKGIMGGARNLNKGFEALPNFLQYSTVYPMLNPTLGNAWELMVPELQKPELLQETK
mgnify:CR=1 FL=1